MSPVEEIQAWWDGMTPEQRESVAKAEGVASTWRNWSQSWSELPAVIQRMWVLLAYDEIAGRDNGESDEQDSAASG